MILTEHNLVAALAEAEGRSLHPVAYLRMARAVLALAALSNRPEAYTEVDLHGPATDHMRETLIGLFVAGVLSEGQTAKATGLDRVEVRRRALDRVEQFYAL